MSTDTILGEGFDGLPATITPTTASITPASKPPGRALSYVDVLTVARDSFRIRWADLIPPGVRYRAKMAQTLHKVWLLLLLHAKPQQGWRAFPAQDEIADYLHLGSRHTVRSYTRLLRDVGLLENEGSAGATGCYRLHPERMLTLPSRSPMSKTTINLLSGGPRLASPTDPDLGNGGLPLDRLKKPTWAVEKDTWAMETGTWAMEKSTWAMETDHLGNGGGHLGNGGPPLDMKLKNNTKLNTEGEEQTKKGAVPDFRHDETAGRNDRTADRQEGIPAVSAVGAAAGDRREWYVVPQTDRAVGSPSQAGTDRAVSTVGGLPLVTVPQPAVPQVTAPASGSGAPVRPIRPTYAQTVLPLLTQQLFLGGDSVGYSDVTQRLGGAQPGRLLTTAIQDCYFRALLVHITDTEVAQAVQRAAAREASATAPWAAPGDRDGEVAFALSVPLLSAARGNPRCEAWLREMATARLLLPALAVLTDGTWAQLIAEHSALAPASQSSQPAPSRLRAS